MLVDMGSEVTVLEALPRILAATDVDVGNVVARSFKKRGVNVQTGARVTGIEGARELTVVVGAGVGRAVGDRSTRSSCRVGRAPLARRASGSRRPGSRSTTAASSSSTTSCARTSPGVFAAGDVVDTPQLAHVGFAEAIVVVKTILGEPVTPIDYGKVPWVVYCQPEVAWCGLTEEQAREQGHDVVVSTHRFGGDARALILGETEGLVKLVTDADGLLLGVHFVGPWATELLAEGYLAVNWEANARRHRRAGAPAPDARARCSARPRSALTGRAAALTTDRPHEETRSGRDDAPAGGDGHGRHDHPLAEAGRRARRRPTSRCSRCRPTRSTRRSPRRRPAW